MSVKTISSSVECCPLCGSAATPPKDIQVSLENNLLYYKGTILWLTRTYTTIAYVLCRSMPLYVSTENLIKQVYGPRGAKPKTIYTHISLMNEQLKGIGLKIFHRQYVGYRLKEL